MKNHLRLCFIPLLIILCFTFLSACSSGAPVSESDSAAVPQAQVSEGQVQEQPEEQHQEQTPEEAPAEAEPEETSEVPIPEKPAIPEETASQAAEKSDGASLQIEGNGIEKAITISLEDLKAMKESYLEDDFFSLNSYGTKEYFHFKGVKLKAILEKAGLKDSAKSITFIATDGYKLEMTLEQALREDYIDEQNPDKLYPCIIAWHENGKDYDVKKGAPFRLVVGQKEPGDVNKPQWVQNISKIIID